MKKNDLIQTKRFLGVRIQKVFRTEANARKAGFTEPTYYDGPESDRFGVLGKSLDLYHMIFAAYRK